MSTENSSSAAGGKSKARSASDNWAEPIRQERSGLVPSSISWRLRPTGGAAPVTEEGEGKEAKERKG